MRSPWTISTCTLLTTLGAILFDNAYAFTYPPVAAPLVVKTPYLNTWLFGKDANIVNSWPRSGGNGGITGWAGLARVDGVGCNYLGNGSNGTQIAPSGQLQSTTITATQTQYVVRCGGVDLKVTYLSPIEPSDFVRLSLPFTYLSVTASPIDGRQHSVQVYADLAGEWLGPDSAATMTWSTQKTQTMVYHQFQLASPTQYGARDDRVIYGHAYHAILQDTGVTYQTAPDVNLRTWFNSTGSLNNTQDTTSRAIGDRWPCMALSKDLGTINTESKPVVFVVGLTRDPAISYQTSGGPQARSLYYRTQLSNDEDAISFFLNDYDNAVASANNFDAKVNSAASHISNDYVDIAVMAARQTFAHVELTVSTGSDGNLNKSDPLLFMGLDGVNSLDEIYASSPFWVWANPDLLGLLLQPVVQWHRNIGSTNAAVGNRVIDNLGGQYPQASGPQTTALNAKSLESTADLMLSTAAFVKAKGDYSIVEGNIDLYRSWGNFLKDNAMYPAIQLTTDGDIIGNPTNDTNLAAKSIIALKAFSDVLTSIGQDASPYHDTATNYASTWQQAAATTTAFAMSFGNPNSWSMMYNLFCDKWLKTGLFTDDVYSKLGSLYSSNMNTYGLALNSNTTLTSPHWMMFAAGLAPETSTRDLLVARTKNFIQSGDSNVPWASYIGVTNGKTVDNTFNRASIGGVYALLVRDLEPAPSASSAMPNYPSLITLVTSFVLLFTLPFLH